MELKERTFSGNSARAGHAARLGFLLPICLAPRVAARALSRNSARTGRATRLGFLLPISLAPRVAARALSRNSARTGHAARLGFLLPISLAPRVAARALKARKRCIEFAPAAQTKPLPDSFGPSLGDPANGFGSSDRRCRRLVNIAVHDFVPPGFCPHR
jgi:hypothetical protein